MKGAETQISMIIGAPPAPSSIIWTPGLFSADLVPVMRITATTDTSFEFWYSDKIRSSIRQTLKTRLSSLGALTSGPFTAYKQIKRITFMSELGMLSGYLNSLRCQARRHLISLE
jgi:hypothetical protein